MTHELGIEWNERKNLLNDSLRLSYMHEIDELTSMKQERITDAQNLIAAINDIKYRLGLDITEKEVNMIPCL